MKKLQPVTEAEVIAEFLKNEFYHEDFHRDREKFERVVLNADLSDNLENGLRRALLFRRRGHMWRELPSDTQWWLVQVDHTDLARIRVFPRAQWRKISNGSFLLSEIVDRIRTNHFSGSTSQFISKVQLLSYRLRKHPDTSSVLLIGVDENRPLTILEGNHRMTAAVLASPDLLPRQFRVLCGFSPHMAEVCWYETNFATLLRYLKNRVHHFYDKDADVGRALQNWVTYRPGPIASVEESTAVAKNLDTQSAILDSK